MLRIVRSLANAILYASAVVSGVLAILLMLGVSLEVLSRQFLGLSYPLVLDFSESSLLVMTFLPAAWVLRQESHVRIDVFTRVLLRRQRELLDTVVSLISAAVMLVVTLVGVNETLKDMRLDRIFGGSMVYMRWWMTIAIPIGAGLMVAAYLVRSWESFQGSGSDGRSPRPGEARESSETTGGG